MIDDEKDVCTNFYSMALVRRKETCLAIPFELFLENFYEGEWLENIC